MATREILHVDVDAFFASVEQMDNPELKGKPVIVGGSTGLRGVVSTASYEARRFGVHSAQPMTEARRLCPQGVFLKVRMDRYQEVSRRIHKILSSYTPKIEPISIDEAFLDVGGCEKLFGKPEDGTRSWLGLAVLDFLKYRYKPTCIYLFTGLTNFFADI